MGRRVTVLAPDRISARTPQYGSATIRALATATPSVRRTQDELTRELADLWGLRGAALARWRRIARGTGIRSRAAVLPVGQTPRLTTGQRMRLYESHAPSLAAAPARAALRCAGVEPGRVTDLIVVTCTGFSAPGVDLALADRLGLAPTVRRQVIGFMGCFGAITGLRAAAGVCAAEPTAVTLVVCAELCSLHLRQADDAANLVASALFSDGAAAVVVTGACWSGAGPDHASAGVAGLAIDGLGRSVVAPGTAGAMSWRITDAGFAMTLSEDVPAILGESMRELVGTDRAGALAVHPGGPAILDAVERAVGHGRDLDDARGVLRDHGNMSSPSVLFVLEQLAARQRVDRATLAAFGPGLSLETISLCRR